MIVSTRTRRPGWSSLMSKNDSTGRRQPYGGLVGLAIAFWVVGVARIVLAVSGDTSAGSRGRTVGAVTGLKL